jgi:hypothetical protein
MYVHYVTNTARMREGGCWAGSRSVSATTLDLVADAADVADDVEAAAEAVEALVAALADGVVDEDSMLAFRTPRNALWHSWRNIVTKLEEF